jgi:uncharacterized protein (DUF952 family)
VDVLFRTFDGERWIAATVVAHAHPGVWVAAPDGSRWFVTNGTRIRPRTVRPRTVFKIASREEWDATCRDGVYPGSPADRRDGFVHFSTSEQAPETAAKHFAGRSDLVLLDVDLDALERAAPGALRWEPSRGCQLFPHLHAPLPRTAITRCRPLPIGADGRHEFPDDA